MEAPPQNQQQEYNTLQIIFHVNTLLLSGATLNKRKTCIQDTATILQVNHNFCCAF